MKSAIILVDHGSRVADANHQLERVAERLRERVPERLVKTAHMELAEPSLDQAIDACAAAGAEAVVVHPYFLAPGRHSREDIPRLAAAAAARHPGLRVTVSEPLGVHPGLVDAVLERVSECEDRSRNG